ncbi:MAG TPA: PRC-barrel domain-containing protein [Steroidobacteraceae bacterium]|nr:PRC-barrel domain-containing protein [Steroidobacteraceae bacterium]
MIRIFLPLICAALGFAAASCSQSGGPLAPAADAPASPRASSQGATAEAAAMATPRPDGAAKASAADDASPSASSQADAAQAADTSSIPDAPGGTPLERRASTLIGMPVVSADGSSLGAVNDIIFDGQGRATHLVIAGASTGGKLTAMPWDAAMASIKDGRLVLDEAKLQSAPSFTRDAWPNLDDPSWSTTTDTYWRKAVRAAIEANPGAPIDSTSRRRARPSRDGG